MRSIASGDRMDVRPNVSVSAAPRPTRRLRRHPPRKRGGRGRLPYFAFSFSASSRNSRRRILPTLVFGSVSRNSMWRGRL